MNQMLFHTSLLQEVLWKRHSSHPLVNLLAVTCFVKSWLMKRNTLTINTFYKMLNNMNNHQCKSNSLYMYFLDFRFGLINFNLSYLTQ